MKWKWLSKLSECATVLNFFKLILCSGKEQTGLPDIIPQ